MISGVTHSTWEHQIHSDGSCMVEVYKDLNRNTDAVRQTMKVGEFKIEGAATMYTRRFMETLKQGIEKIAEDETELPIKFTL